MTRLVMNEAKALTRADDLVSAREVIRLEANELLGLADRLDSSVCESSRLIARCEGIVHVSGIGKAGLVGQKVAATMSSFGIRSIFLHPAEAVHGDMGRITSGDVLLALSQSGESEELLRFVSASRPTLSGLIAVTQNGSNPLGRTADIVVPIGDIREACPMGLAPTTSTTAMMALGDAIAILAAQYRGVAPHHFAANHPGGKLGRKLAAVDRIMRKGRHVRTATSDEIVRDVLLRQGGARRRSGAILVVDRMGGTLVGIFTDSDLVRLLERGRAAMLDRSIGESMTPDPTVVLSGSSVADAVDALRSRKLSELPVVDEKGIPVGLVDVTDLIGMVDCDLDEDFIA